MVLTKTRISKLKNFSFLNNKSFFDVEVHLPNKKNPFKKI